MGWGTEHKGARGRRAQTCNTFVSQTPRSLHRVRLQTPAEILDPTENRELCLSWTLCIKAAWNPEELSIVKGGASLRAIPVLMLDCHPPSSPCKKRPRFGMLSSRGRPRGLAVESKRRHTRPRVRGTTLKEPTNTCRSLIPAAGSGGEVPARMSRSTKTGWAKALISPSCGCFFPSGSLVTWENAGKGREAPCIHFRPAPVGGTLRREPGTGYSFVPPMKSVATCYLVERRAKRGTGSIPLSR